MERERLLFAFSMYSSCCTGGVALREAPLFIPAHHFTEHMKVLQSFKKGVAHILCCTPSFWRSSGTLHSAFINVCAECKTERGKDGGCCNIHWFGLSFFCGK
ncbi:uncharacterized protein LOC123514396 [Portunus trituberculatus]|uniref:uncharacterized protein LOC123514396 n=1 Tax=Portunus trituberculatus TaxID=210409 RepID=UPI001E1D12A9|nr:uncharacterized protein LOC123514396 [Portunus trituberculatus]